MTALSAEERQICSLCKGSETVWCKVKLEADTFREMPCPACQMPDYRDVVAGMDIREQAARADERRKVIEETVGLMRQQAKAARAVCLPDDEAGRITSGIVNHFSVFCDEMEAMFRALDKDPSEAA